MSITQQEFDFLITLPKQFKENEIIHLDNRWSKEIISLETRDTFILDYHFGTICFENFTYNKRYRSSIILLRYDSSGRHTNPNGDRFEGAHVHIHHEEAGDKIAYPVTEIGVEAENTEKSHVLLNLLTYCNVRNLPEIQTVLM